MTVKTAINSNDRIRPSKFARNLHFPQNPLRSFKVFEPNKRISIFLVLFAAIIGGILMISQAFGASDHSQNTNLTNSSDAASSNQQTPKNSSENSSPSSSRATSTKSSNNTSTASNLSSTAITVNGQSVAVPQSGNYDKTMNVSGSNVHVSGTSSQSTTGGSATNSATTNVEINSE